MKVLKTIFGLLLVIIIGIPCILAITMYIFGLSVYGHIKYKESFKKIWTDLFHSFIEGIEIGLNEHKKK